MSRRRAPAVECDMCGKPIAADAWHYLIERDSGELLVWCYRCADTSRAHRKLSPKCREMDRCDIWYLHPGYRLVICESRSAYWRDVEEREDRARRSLSRGAAPELAASAPPEAPARAPEVKGSAAGGSR